MAHDMSFGVKDREKQSSMSQENGFDFLDLYQNEDSIDISNYMTSANLELCDDDLFQSLFPSSPETVIKKEKPDPFESELDWWTEPGSAYSSACSSAAPSPVQFFNTPPVTPQSDHQNNLSPGKIRHQLQQDRISQLNMSRTQFTPINSVDDASITEIKEITPLQVTIKSDPDDPQANQLYYMKAECDMNNNAPNNVTFRPDLIKLSPRESRNSSQGGLYGNSRKRLSEDSLGEGKPVKKSKAVIKDSEEYKMKRERNNVAVRKSRDKAKIKFMETQGKVSELSNENKRLHERVAELTHELNTLKGVLKSLPHQLSK